MEDKFVRPELEHKELIDKYLKMQKKRSCDHTFSNTLLWGRYYGVTFKIVNDMLIFKTKKKHTFFSFPVGKEEGLKSAIDYIMEECSKEGEPFNLHLVTPEQFEMLEQIYPGKFQIEYNRDASDYVYETEKLINLSGKKYHGKKNHINRFLATNPTWSYEVLNDENMEECFQMALQWRNENEVEGDEEKTAEMNVTLNALRLYKELELKGGLLKIDGKVIAFTLGEPVCDDTFVVHIEKAFGNIQGTYPMINQQFLIHEASTFPYVNREEDMGSEGLRKAKLSYRPIFMVEKGVVTLKQ